MLGVRKGGKQKRHGCISEPLGTSRKCTKSRGDKEHMVTDGSTLGATTTEEQNRIEQLSCDWQYIIAFSELGRQLI